MSRRTRKRVRPEQILAQAATPLFLVLADRRIAFFNSGIEKLTGWAAGEVVGQVCEYVALPEAHSVEALAASLCPPHEAFGGQPVAAPVCIASRNGETATRTVHFLPIEGESGQVAAILGMVAGVAEPARAAEIGKPHHLHAELAALRLALARRFGTQSLVCKSDAMLRVAEQVSIARSTHTAVLLFGEKGSGKEHLARAIHYESDRRTRSFVPLDCERLSALELEQTLRRLFEVVGEDEPIAASAALRPGTLFLPQVEQLPRDLQQMVVEAFRGEHQRPHALRILAATTLDPAELAKEDRLRPDFYHLLTPLCIAVPSLRHRMHDFRYLAQHLLEELNRGDSRQLNGFADDVWEKFNDYNWPGNVDELLAVIRESREACDGPLIRAKHLPFRFRTGLDAQAIGPVLRPQIAPLEPLLARTEKQQIEQALAQCRHNKSKAAQLLGMTRPKLYRRMEILGISAEAEAG